jgi:hypothetical protein
MEEPRKAKLGFLLVGAMVFSVTALLFFRWLAEGVLEADTEGFDTCAKHSAQMSNLLHVGIAGEEAKDIL